MEVVAHLVAESATEGSRVSEQRDREQRAPCPPQPWRRLGHGRAPFNSRRDRALLRVVPRVVPLPPWPPRCRGRSAGNSGAAHRHVPDPVSRAPRSAYSRAAAPTPGKGYRHAARWRRRSGIRLPEGWSSRGGRYRRAPAGSRRRPASAGERIRRKIVHVCVATIHSTHIDGQAKRKVAKNRSVPGAGAKC